MSDRSKSPPEVYGSLAESGEGVGGVCTPPGTGGVNERVNESGSGSTEKGIHSFIHSGGCTDQLARTLLEVGVFVLSTQKRRALAASLVADGMSAADVVALSAFVGDAEKDGPTARKFLCALLVDPEKRRDAIANLRAFQAAQGRPKWVPPPVSPEHWDHDEQCRRAWCCHRDGKSLEEIRAIFGVEHLSMVESMLARGRVISAPDPKLVAPKGAVKAEAAEKAETQARLQRVQQILAERRAVRA